MPRPSPVKQIRAAVAAAIGDARRVGVACSGGADSVALLDAAISSGVEVVALHVDHGLQPGSKQAASKVARLAKRLGAEAVILAVKVGKGASLEDQARRARYAAIEAAAAERALPIVLAGHTARDQAETVLLRILRGTGPAGLVGIPATRGVHRRPLLAMPRATIEAYVAARELPVIEDPMNSEARFTRVRVRQFLSGEHPRVEDALLRLARSAAEWAEVIDAAAARVPLTVDALRAAGPAIGKRALQLRAPGLEADHLDAAYALIDARSGQGIDVPGGRVERSFDEIVVTSGPPARLPLHVEPPYSIRVWRAGDRMRPARLRGRSRKLSDLYADARVPRTARATARVVLDAEGEIVWAEHLGPAFGSTITATSPM